MQNFFLISTDWAYKSAPNVQKRVCNVCVYSDWASILHATAGGWVCDHFDAKHRFLCRVWKTFWISTATYSAAKIMQYIMLMLAIFETHNPKSYLPVFFYYFFFEIPCRSVRCRRHGLLAHRGALRDHEDQRAGPNRALRQVVAAWTGESTVFYYTYLPTYLVHLAMPVCTSVCVLICLFVVVVSPIHHQFCIHMAANYCYAQTSSSSSRHPRKEKLSLTTVHLILEPFLLIRVAISSSGRC